VKAEFTILKCIFNFTKGELYSAQLVAN